jgi:TetR/AcrR family transcriptional repressor of nem operon
MPESERATDTRTRLLDAAEQLVLDRGFAGTTVGAVIDRVGVTKGAFFHHFDSKAELGRALVERYAEADIREFEQNLALAERLSDDPLRQMLAFVTLYQEKMEGLEAPYAGCLMASYCYEQDLLDEETLSVGRRTMAEWRRRLSEKLDRVVEEHPPAGEVDIAGLADMVTVIVEGAFVLSRTMREPDAVARQLGHYRRYLELLFEG